MMDFMVLLFITGQEWLIILIALIILIIWGPSKIPELARGIGKAIREFRRGMSEIEETAQQAKQQVQQAVAAAAQPQASQAQPQVRPEVLELARRYGIDVSGKTEEEILREVLERSKAQGQQ